MQNYTDEIIAKFPNLTCSVLNGGVNVYYHKYVITIYWKKQLYCDTKKHKWVRFTSLEAIMQVIEAASMPKGKKVAVIKPNEEIEDMLSLVQEHNKVQNEIAKEQLDDYCDFKSKKGVQSCLDHIQKKIDYGQANNLSPSNVAMLNNLLQELRQYL